MTDLPVNEFETGEDKFQHLISQAPVFIVTLNGPTFIVETINKIALEIWGKTYDGVINRPLFESSPEIEGVFKQIFDNIYSSGESFTANEITVQLKRPGKSDTAYFDMLYQPLRDVDNKIYGIIAIGTEITEAVNARKKTEASELFSRTILESSPDCIKVLDLEGKIQFMNFNGLCQMEVDDFSTFKNKNWWSLWGDENEALAKAAIDKALRGETAKFTALCHTAKGTPRWWDVVVAPVAIPGEPVQQIISVSRDVTQQKESELRLKSSEEKYRGLFETMDQGLAIVEMIYDETNKPVDFRYIETNPLFKKQSGLPDVINKTIKELVPDIDDFWVETYEKVLLSGEPVRFTQEAAAMNSWFDVNAFRLGEKGSKKVAILFANITEQKKSQEALDKIASHLKLATDSANVGVWSLDIQTEELEWSALHKRMWGYDEHRTDLTYEDWHTLILAEDKALAFKRVEDARFGHTLYEVEYRIKRPNDHVIRWMKDVGQYYYNKAGEAITLTGISIDITEQKSFTEELEKKVSERTLELAIRTRQLEEINKTLDVNNMALENANAELTSFSYIASHDLQEPLRMIKMFSNRILEAENFSDKTQQYFNFITAATERMRNLIVSLIDYSRIDRTELKLVSCDLNTIVEESKSDLQLSIAEKNAIVELGNLPTINGLPVQLSQVFMNLISNAIKYSRPDIIPQIKITSERIHAQQIDHPEAIKQLEYYAIKIADNGIGFEEEYATKIFDAFKRLHGRSEYSGTGIGLSIVKKIVTNHHGFIVAEGKPGIGSTFTIYIPTT